MKKLEGISLLLNFLVVVCLFGCSHGGGYGEYKNELNWTKINVHALDKKAEQEELITYLINDEELSDIEAIKIMRKVYRLNYVNNTRVESIHLGYMSYIDIPHWHSFVIEKFVHHIKPGMRVVDIGCGSGYLTACFGLMLKGNGSVIAIDLVPQITELARMNIQRDQPQLIRDGMIKFVTMDAKDGAYEFAPYDAIYVGGAVPEIPQAMLRQLNKGGRMLITVGRKVDTMDVVIVDKDIYGNYTYNRTHTIHCNTLYDKDYLDWLLDDH